MKTSLLVIAALALPLAAPGAAAQSHDTAQRRHAAMDSWDGRWTGEWNCCFDDRRVAVTISGGRVVSYEFGGSTNSVSSSRVTPLLVIFYSSTLSEPVTMIRNDVNRALATSNLRTGGALDAVLSRR